MQTVVLFYMCLLILITQLLAAFGMSLVFKSLALIYFRFPEPSHFEVEIWLLTVDHT